MINFVLEPKPYKVIIDSEIRWEPEFILFLFRANEDIAKLFYWKKNYQFNSEEEANNFILGYLSKTPIYINDLNH